MGIEDDLTLLDPVRQLYLNEGMKGGETSFPRWVNAETFNELKVVPEIGKAVLFYSQLPDGNFDDFSQHAAQPVIEGEKVQYHRNRLGTPYPLSKSYTCFLFLGVFAAFYPKQWVRLFLCRSACFSVSKNLQNYIFLCRSLSTFGYGPMNIVKIMNFDNASINVVALHVHFFRG